MKFNLVNKSTKVTDEEFKLMADACEIQLKEHAAPAWDKTPWEIEVGMGDGYQITLLDDSDHAGALGYHTETPDGKIWGRVFVNSIIKFGGTLFEGGKSVSATLSHEVLEAFIDPNVNVWADRGDDVLVAMEVCDPVQRDSYEITVGDKRVSVSNFTLPAYFDARPPAGAKFDYLSKLTGPFDMTRGGYILARETDGKISSKFASLEEQAEHEQLKPPHPASRTSRKKKHQ